MHALHDIHIPSFGKPNSATSEFYCIDGLRIQGLSKIRGGYRRNHQRQDQGIIIAHFKDNKHCCQRGTGTGSKNSGHAYQGIGTGRTCNLRLPGRKQRPHSAAKHCTCKKGRSKDTAGITRPQSKRGGKRFYNNEQGKEPEVVRSVQGVLDKGES